MKWNESNYNLFVQRISFRRILHYGLGFTSNKLLFLACIICHYIFVYLRFTVFCVCTCLVLCLQHTQIFCTARFVLCYTHPLPDLLRTKAETFHRNDVTERKRETFSSKIYQHDLEFRRMITVADPGGALGAAAPRGIWRKKKKRKKREERKRRESGREKRGKKRKEEVEGKLGIIGREQEYFDTFLQENCKKRE